MRLVVLLPGRRTAMIHARRPVERSCMPNAGRFTSHTSSLPLAGGFRPATTRSVNFRFMAPSLDNKLDNTRHEMVLSSVYRTRGVCASAG